MNKVNKSGDTIAGDLVIPVGITLSFHTNGYFGYYLRDNGEKLQVLDHDNHMLLQFGYNSVPETIGGVPLATTAELLNKAVIFTSLGQLGLSGAVTMTQVCAALPNECIFRMRNSLHYSDKVSDAPVEYCQITINNSIGGYTRCEAFDTIDNRVYTASYRPNTSPAFSGWIPTATTTPPEEHALPLAEGKIGADYNACRKEQNGRVTLFVSIRRADGADLTGYEGAFTLPIGFRPYRNEVRRIDLSGADGNPAGYAHLHIYPDGNAGIAGFGTGAKTAFCECGFWTAQGPGNVKAIADHG